MALAATLTVANHALVSWCSDRARSPRNVRLLFAHPPPFPTLAPFGTGDMTRAVADSASMTDRKRMAQRVLQSVEKASYASPTERAKRKPQGWHAQSRHVLRCIRGLRSLWSLITPSPIPHHAIDALLPPYSSPSPHLSIQLQLVTNGIQPRGPSPQSGSTVGQIRLLCCPSRTCSSIKKERSAFRHLAARLRLCVG